MNPKLDQLRRRYANQGRVAEASEPYILGPSSLAEHTERPMSDTDNAQTNSSANQKPAPDAGTDVQSKNREAAFEGPPPSDVARTIAALFEPARQYRERVSRSFEAVHALRAELQVLAEAVGPLNRVERSVLEIVEMLRTQLSDLAMTMEGAKALRLQLSALHQVPQAAPELVSKIRELSKTFNVDTDEESTNNKRMLIEKKTHTN